MKRSSLLFAAVLAMFVTVARGAVTLSFSTTQPATDSFDVFNFTANATIPGNTPFAYNAQAFSDNDGPPGQTFTTPAGTIPFALNSISLKGANTGILNSGGGVFAAGTTWGIRFSARFSAAAGRLIPLVSVTGIPTVTGAVGNEWFTFTFSGIDRDRLTTLLPNTTYAFDVFSSGTSYLGFAGTTNATAYAGGFAFNTTGTDAAARSLSGTQITDRGYDRTFHVDLVGVPEPSTTLLAVIGGGVLLGLSLRRRS